MKVKIISGGQTGVDQSGLRAARLSGLQTGGWIAKGWMTELGPAPDLGPLFNLKEWPERGYPARTKQNVKESDATILVVSNRKQIKGGTGLTLKLIKDHAKPFLIIDLSDLYVQEWPKTIVQWIRNLGIQILNVAGPRCSSDPELDKASEEILVKIFTAIKKAKP